MGSTVDAKRNSDVTPIVAHVATLLTLAHRFPGTHAGRRIAGHNAAASHGSPNFIPGAMLSEVTSLIQ